MAIDRTWLVRLGVATTTVVAVGGATLIWLVVSVNRELRVMYGAADLLVLGYTLVEFAEANEGRLPAGEDWQSELLNAGVHESVFTSSIGDDKDPVFFRTEVAELPSDRPVVIAYENPEFHGSKRMRIAVTDPGERTSVLVYWVERDYWNLAKTGEVPPETALERARRP
ncbi:MAG: hypothetical protein AAF297_04075 [Planctomycetota bacterium]